MPTKDDPRITLRLSRALRSRLGEAAEQEGLSVSAFTVRAVEQALGKRGAGSPAKAGRPAGDPGQDVDPSAGDPTPAEPPEEPYVPEWKKRSLGSRPHGAVPKGKP